MCIRMCCWIHCTGTRLMTQGERAREGRQRSSEHRGATQCRKHTKQAKVHRHGSGHSTRPRRPQLRMPSAGAGITAISAVDAAWAAAISPISCGVLPQCCCQLTLSEIWPKNIAEIQFCTQSNRVRLHVRAAAQAQNNVVASQELSKVAVTAPLLKTRHALQPVLPT